VPNDFDYCPTTYDPDQWRKAGTGPNDACLAPPPDGGGNDLMPAADLGTVPVDASAPICPAAAVLCDTFEGSSLDSRWTTYFSVTANGPPRTAAGAAALDSTQHHSGAQSLRASNEGRLGLGEWTKGALYEKATFPSVKNVFVRAFVYVPGGFPTLPGTLLRVGTGGSESSNIDLLLSGGGFQIASDLKFTVTKATAVAGSFPHDQWFCLEWNIAIGNSAATPHVWVDDSEIAELAAMSWDTTDQYVNSVTVGLIGDGNAQNAVSSSQDGPINARHLWLDDVAIGASRLGCSN
jgi:hypothetical protein